ncbi:MAG: PspC domain-containing protein [Clostridiales bacterium]|nr:PspC domain-containing protein [Clostridiales bacterium]
MERKLTRNTANRIFGGVCSGIAAFLGLSPSLVRVVFVIATVCTWGFPIIAVYLALWVILPAGAGVHSAAGLSGQGVVWLAAALIASGILLIFRELLPVDLAPYLFPAGLIAGGALLLWASFRK